VIATGGVAGPILLMIGLAHTPASAASLLLNLEGLATMALAWVVFREATDRRLVLGALAILAGAALLSWQGPGAPLGWGPLAIAGACLAWAIDNNLTRRLSAADPVELAMIKGLVAGPVNLALAAWHGGAWPEPAAIAGAMVVGFAGYGVSLALFVLALRHLGTARTGAYFSTAPFIGALLAILLLGEPVTVPLVAAALLMGLGLYWHVAERHEHEHGHEALAHAHRHHHDAHHRHAHDPADPPGEPHSHWHVHAPLVHRHPHYPDLHHRHRHG
jgi:drug/metabolite transporter (DMT)-like permease